MTRAFGWVAPERLGRPAHSGVRATGVSGLPSHVSLRRPPVLYDQGAVGSCVAQALAYAVECLAIHQGLPADRPDRTALYYRCRRAIGTTGEDSGAIIADGIEALREGWETEVSAPSTFFDDSYTAPPPPLRPDAPRVVSAEALAHDLDTVLWEIACGHPVVIGVRLTRQWDASGEVIGPPEGDDIGGHAMTVLDYQREGSRVMLATPNSWGNDGPRWFDSSWLSLARTGELHALRSIRRSHAA